VVCIRGKNKKATVLVILANKDIDNKNARIVAIVKYNLDVSNSNKIFIIACKDIKSICNT
jgi:hypothetical protein